MTTTKPVVLSESDGYPRADGETHYGLTVWDIGEDGDAFVIEGHDPRRTMAAFSRLCRGRYGRREFKTGDVKPAHSYVQFVDQCGCTETEHAQHVSDAEDDPDGLDCDCRWRGLPPCRMGEEFSWYAHGVPEGTPSALPVTWVRF